MQGKARANRWRRFWICMGSDLLFFILGDIAAVIFPKSRSQAAYQIARL